jgi:glycine/D-amino acid oxidase-like deaminating enzyme
MERNLLSICVIGGGFTGAAAAIACLKRIEQPFSLTIRNSSLVPRQRNGRRTCID